MRITEEGAQFAGRYTLIRRLGAGPASETWLAEDQQTDSRVAVKFLAAASADDARARQLFHREWRIGSRLMHANIVRIFEYHDEPERPFFGLQFAGSTDISVTATADPADALRPLCMIADALRYAHGKGIVHRDIKASNILLDRRGIPYLVDFGVAAAIGSAEMGSSGSAIAQSPAQRNGEAAAAADDIYSLGVLMHELLTGAPPAGGIAEHLPDGSPVPGALRGLLDDMLAADADERPDAEQVAARLADAGYPPGPAPNRYVAGQEGAGDVVAAIESTRRFRRAAAPQEPAATGEATSHGISPKMLYGALGVAVTLLLAVVFVLPSVVDGPGDRRDVRPVVGETADIGDPVEAAGPAEEDEPEAPRPVASGTAFSENLLDASGVKAQTDVALGDLLSQLERLRYRGIERWGGQPFLDAVDVYAEGDQAYVDRNYRLAGEKYRTASRMLEPFFDRIDSVFQETLAAAKEAFANGDPSESVRLYDLAVAITPGNREAEAGLARARNLASVLSLVEQGIGFEKDLELEAARQAFEKAIELDGAWQPALDGLERVRLAVRDRSFDQRMTEGFSALADGDYASARAAFNAAKRLMPGSTQPVDGLLQVDQEARLADIRRLEREADALVDAEQWEGAIGVYEDVLKIDRDLQFAQEGLAAARSRAALHKRLQAFIDKPDQLSDPVTMQNATQILLDLARMEPIGPRLNDQKTELSRLLKRAATTIRVQLRSDNLTEVAIYKVGQFGNFSSRELELRPGTYVAVGNRPGYRDVRVEFRVGPEIDLQPIVVQCEEPI